jgi:hypothetical protein
MSYNLYAEGDLDFVEVSRMVRRYEGIEVFPIAADGLPDALGIAVPSSRADERARDELDQLIRHLWAAEAKVFDLYAGTRIASDADLTAVYGRIFGPA